jgi:hypothetical protein
LSWRRLGAGAVAAIAAALTACSSGSGTGHTVPPVTGLSGEARLYQLTPDELTRLCQDTAAYVEAVLPSSSFCRPSAISAAAAIAPTPTPEAGDADLQRACVLAYASCLVNTSFDAGAAAEPGATAPWFGCAGFPSDCQATIAGYSACVRDATTLAARVYGALPTCNQLTLASLTAMTTDAGANVSYSAPPTCVEVQAECPNIYIPAPLTGL